MGRAAPLLPGWRGAKVVERRYVTHPTAILLSLVIIVAMWQVPVSEQQTPEATVLNPSMFRGRPGTAFYARPRAYEAYTWAKVCGANARARFMRRFKVAPNMVGVRTRKPRTMEQTGRRVLISHIPTEVGDGLGHRMCIVNYELLITMQLGVSYSHRVSSYGSLTVNDRLAVERFFGWGANETMRDTLLDQVCARTVEVNDTCEIPAKSRLCDSLRKPGDGASYAHAVYVPDAIAECYLDREEKETIAPRCYALAQSFATQFPDPNTAFLLRPRRCFRDYLYTNFTNTVGWFRDKYWTAHADDAPDAHLEASKVHIALHVRRGDFFNYTNRILIADSTYADMAARVVVALNEMVHVSVPYVVHVYSEGVPRRHERLKDNHDVQSMERVYANELGQRKRSDHWERLLRSQRRLVAARPNIEVRMHIATHTLTALHQMIAADFFVGSISGLSTQVVRSLGRGVIMLPIADIELMAAEKTISFDYARNGVPSFVNESLLYERIAHYARENRLACAVW